LTPTYYSDIKKNEIMSFAGKLMKLKIIMSSRINPTQKDKYSISYFLSCAESRPEKNKRHKYKRGIVREDPTGGQRIKGEGDGELCVIRKRGERK
jgi:hypothetical protein